MFWPHQSKAKSLPSPALGSHFSLKTAYVVSSSAPSVQRSKALRADTLFANSTMPFPVGRPRSSVTTTARSTGPNWENAWGGWSKTDQGLKISRSPRRYIRQTQEMSEVHLFQQLVCDNGQEVPHFEGGAVRGETDPDWPVTRERPVQLGFGDLCQCPRFLELKKRKHLRRRIQLFTPG